MLSCTFEGYLSLFALFRVEEKILWEDLEVFETVDEFDYSQVLPILGEVGLHILGLTKPKTVNVMKQAYMAYKSRLNIIAEVY